MSHETEIFADWRDISTAPEHRSIMVRSKDGIYLAEKSGNEWIPTAYVPDENPAPPTMWAPAPIVPKPRAVEDTIDWLEDEDREMIIACYEGDRAPDQLDSEFLEDGVFAPELRPSFRLGAHQHAPPCSYGIGWKLTAYGEKVAEALIALEEAAA
jgi:hypothetical protein